MRFIVLCFLVLSQFSFGISNPVVGGGSTGTITENGDGELEVSGRTDYPYVVYYDIIEQVSVDTIYIDFCGGAILNERAIVSVAHCLRWTIKEPEIIVHAGILHKEIEKGQDQQIPMWDYLYHEDYISDRVVGDKVIFDHNDISLIWLSKALEFNPKVQKIDLFGSSLEITGLTGSVLGWGSNNTIDSTSKMLLKGEMKVLSWDECSNADSDILNQGMICALSEGKNVSSCKGDSGTPFIIDGKLAGVMQFGFIANRTIEDGSYALVCDPEKPAFMANVKKYTDWINSNLQNGPPRDRPNSAHLSF